MIYRAVHPGSDGENAGQEAPERSLLRHRRMVRFISLGGLNESTMPQLDSPIQPGPSPPERPLLLHRRVARTRYRPFILSFLVSLYISSAKSLGMRCGWRRRGARIHARFVFVY